MLRNRSTDGLSSQLCKANYIIILSSYIGFNLTRFYNYNLMDSKTLKIKIFSNQLTASRIDREIGSNLSKSNENSSQQFNQLVQMFKMFMKTSAQKSTRERCTPQLEPRDRQISIPRHKSDALAEKELSVNQWLTDLFKTVHSSAFNYYSKNQMNFQQTKIFCAENIFKNIIAYAKQKKIGTDELLAFDNYIEKKILKYLKCKYPITESKEVNKKLSETVRQINKYESPIHNYTDMFKIPFFFRQDGNYHDLIMRTMNELMKRVDGITDVETEKTLFQKFEDFMNQVFQKAYDESICSKEGKKLSRSSINQQSRKQSQCEIVSMQKTESKGSMERHLSESRESLERQNQKAKARQYTQFKIGRKIPENVPLYTEKQIESKNMTIKHPSILRIVTKWCEELWSKFQETNYYTNRLESVKTLKGGYLNTLLPWMRKDIDSRLAIQKEFIQQYKAQLQKNSYEIQAKILQHELQTHGVEYVQELQKISGKFACRVVKNMQNVMVAYLNRLIHGILKVSKQFYEESFLSSFTCWPSPPNLLSFKIGDIVRCKVSSKEKEIIQIYKELRRISQESPPKLCIIRVKNRLKSGNNDILMNVKFNNQILCEIQLSINTKASAFIKSSNCFNHYLYELQRSEFGSLTELCNIWTSLDNRAAIYENLIEEQDKIVKKQEHACENSKKQWQFHKYQQPFICSRCFEAFYNNNYLFDHLKCSQCDYFVCAKCDVENKTLGDFQRMFRCKKIGEKVKRKLKRDQPLPKNGLCLLIDSKTAKIEQFVHHININNNQQQLFGLKEDGKQIYEIQHILSKKKLQQFWKRYVVFQVKEEYALKLNKQDISYYNLKLKVKQHYRAEKEIISLIDEGLDTNQCRELINLGSREDKNIVKCLFLADNKIDCIPINFSEFSNLRWLTLSRNKIKNFKGLAQLPLLMRFYCKSGQLEQIPPELYKCEKLTQINLYHNKITRIDDNIGNLKILDVLDLTCNHIQTISDEIKHCKMLGELSLSVNRIQFVPGGLFQLQKLRILTLEHNNLKKIPPEIIYLQSLKEFYISFNPELTEIHSNITGLTQLEVLHCGATSLDHLPPKLYQLKSLNQIMVNKTKIQQIPHYFSQFSNLQILNASGFTFIENCKYITNLKELQIKECKLKQLPVWLEELKSLQKIDVSDNQLTQLSAEVLSTLPELIALKAKNNRLTSYPDTRGCPKLTQINLENNQICKIQGQFLENSQNLQYCILTSNLLTSLPYNFTRLSKLIEIQICNNKLCSIIDEKYRQALNKQQKSIWPHLKKVNLDNNKLREIPLYLCKNYNLLELTLSKNLIEKIPIELNLCKKLKIIKIQQNLLTQIPEAIKEINEFKEIYLEKNHITEFPTWTKDYVKSQNFQKCLFFTTKLVDRLIEPKKKIFQLQRKNNLINQENDDKEIGLASFFRQLLMLSNVR